MAGAHPSDGQRHHRSSLERARITRVSGTAVALDTAAATRAPVASTATANRAGVPVTTTNCLSLLKSFHLREFETNLKG